MFQLHSDLRGIDRKASAGTDTRIYSREGVKFFILRVKPGQPIKRLGKGSLNLMGSRS